MSKIINDSFVERGVEQGEHREIPLYAFDIKILTDIDCPSIIIGFSKRSGKTTFAKKLVSYFHKALKYKVLIINGTRDIVDWGEYDMKYLNKNTIDYLNELTQTNMNTLDTTANYENREKMVLVLDDVSCQYKLVSNAPFMSSLFENPRHLKYKITTISIQHDLKTCNRSARMSCDIFALCNCPDEAMAEDLYELTKARDLVSFVDFISFLKKYLVNYHKLIYYRPTNKWYFYK
jgi:hypothetical protein